MSLSLILVPMAIGAVSVAIGTIPDGNLSTSTLPQDKIFYKLNTKMKDEQLLQETLKNYGNSSEVENEEVISTVGDTNITFIKNNDTGTYDAHFHEDIPLTDAEQFMDHIYNEYTRIVQQNTYKKLLERAKNEGLQLESEETNENDSIVLTFEVKE